MIIGLVCPTDTSCLGNPGWHMITAGIRWLVRQAVPGAMFVNVDMLRDDAQQWAAAKRCDALLLCGNPRFSLGAVDAWWESGIWQRLNEARAAGVRVIDAWGGACYPHAEEYPDLDTMAAELEALPRTQYALQVARLFQGVITRDALAQRIYERAGVPSVTLPCSSWWASHELGVAHRGHYVLRDLSAVMLLAMPGHDWLPDAVRRQAGALQQFTTHRGDRIWTIATTWDDYVWAREHGLEARLITDPASLLRVYGRCNEIVSFRVHASIPAASMGAAVATFAVDSRAQICAPFELPVIPFTSLRDESPRVRFDFAQHCDSQPVVNHLRTLLTC